MNQLAVAIRFAIKEQGKNRFALGLLAIFVPLWFWMLGAMTPADALPFKFRATNSLLLANGHNLVLLTAGLNALTLIVGFMFFHSAKQALTFDKRLSMAGYRRISLILAKLIALTTIVAVVALYTTLLMLPFWHNPNNIALVWLSFAMAALIYGSFGLLLGVLLTNELAGFFIVIMVSEMDTFLQNPLGNPIANKDFLLYFPSYGPMQISVAGGFTHAMPTHEILASIGWVAGLIVLAMIIFWLRTRNAVKSHS